MGGILLALLRAPSQMGRRFAPYKRFGPLAQNLGAGGIHFRRACKVSGGPEGRPRACPWVRKRYGLKAARRALPALRHARLRGFDGPASGAAALKLPRFSRRRRRFGHFPNSASADYTARLFKMPPVWAAFLFDASGQSRHASSRGKRLRREKRLTAVSRRTPVQKRTVRADSS